MIRWGLCCIFREVPIKFRRTTAKYLTKLLPDERMHHLSTICLHNARSLLEALRFCRRNGIKAFRINSQILPLKTHPQHGYAIEVLPQSTVIVDAFKKCKTYCRRYDLRTSFHPDQFILLSSPKPEVTRRSIADLRYQAEVAEWVGADVINIHAGGAYGNKKDALDRLARQIRCLPQSVRRRLTLENDDRLYTPRDLLPVCKKLKIPPRIRSASPSLPARRSQCRRDDSSSLENLESRATFSYFEPLELLAKWKSAKSP
jgi:UV DNA damage endonuclease